MRDQVASIHYQGLTGNISFDANGDNTGPKVFSVYYVNNQGAWVFQEVVYG